MTGVARPTGAGFDLVLILHVAAVLVALIALVASVVSGIRLVLAAKGTLPPGVRSYFAPGVNWAGRALYAVPVFGVCLLALSHGAYGFGDAWVDAGLGLWVLAAGAAEGLLWPAERRVQRVLAAQGTSGATGDAPPLEALRAARAVCAGSAIVVGLLVAAIVVMIAQPR